MLSPPDPRLGPSWAEVYGAYAKEIRCFLAPHAPSPEDVEDLLQDIFLRLITHGCSPEDPRAYLYAVARRRLHAYWRRRDTRLAAERAPSAHSEAASADPLEQLRVEEQSRQIAQAMSRLPPALAEILRLRIIEALPADAAARQAGCSPAAAKKRLTRAKRYLKCLCGDIL